MESGEREQSTQTGIANWYLGGEGDRYVSKFRVLYELSSRLNRANFDGHVSAQNVVVDFGCGDGRLLAALDVRNRIGVEATEAGMKLAQERLDSVVRSLEELQDEIADVVISNHALEHTLHPAHELTHMLRVLRPGGRLVVWLPLDDWRSERRADLGNKDHHLYTWTPLLLGNLLTEMGFELEECRIVNRAFPPKLHVVARLLGPERLEGLSTGRGFELACSVWARVARRRQLMAVARRPSPAGGTETSRSVRTA